MKRLFLGAALLTGFISFSFAQTTKPVTLAAAKTTTKSVATNTTVKPAAKYTASDGVVLKKDGTPDKRYKENKNR